jgi:hypothetical protein
MAASRSIDISVESVEETSIQTLRATLGVLRELREGESRVALVPADIKRLSGLMYTSNRAPVATRQSKHSISRARFAVR